MEPHGPLKAAAAPSSGASLWHLSQQPYAASLLQQLLFLCEACCSQLLLLSVSIAYCLWCTSQERSITPWKMVLKQCSHGNPPLHLLLFHLLVRLSFVLGPCIWRLTLDVMTTSLLRARSLLTCVSAMSARSSASSSSCCTLRYFTRLELACCSCK